MEAVARGARGESVMGDGILEPRLGRLFDLPSVGWGRAEAEKKAGQAVGLGLNPRNCLTRSTFRQTYDLKDVTNAADHIGAMPGKGETLHLLLPGNFAAFDLIVAAINLLGGNIDQLTISTLGFNKRNFTWLCEQFDLGKIGSFQVLASEYFRESDRSAPAYATEQMQQRGLRIGFARTHAKIQCLRAGAKFFVFESSANLRSCNCIEQATLTNSAKLYHFHTNWIEEVLNR